MEDLYLSLIKEANGSKFQNLKSAAQCAYGKKTAAGDKEKKTASFLGDSKSSSSYKAETSLKPRLVDVS